MNNTTKIAACLMLCLIAGSSLTGNYTTSVEAAPPPEVSADEMRYPVHVDALREEFQTTGFVTLLVPQLGQIAVTGEENELTSYGNRSMDLPHVHILGGAAGYVGSAANILLGEYGVYGTVEIPSLNFGDALIFDFDALPVNDAGGYEQWVGIRDQGAPEDEANQTLEGPYVGGLDGNNTNGTGVYVGGVDAPEIHVQGPMQAATTMETYRDDDDEMDSWYDFDYSDDVAEKRLYLPYDALTDAVSAQLHVFARASYCGGSTGDAHELFVGAVGQGAHGHGAYNACNRWSTASFSWTAFDVGVNSLVAGQTNRFFIKDYGSSWNDRDHHFAMDTDNDFGQSDATANGNDQPGELMWFLTIESSQQQTTDAPGCDGQNPTGSLEHAQSGQTQYRSTSYSAQSPPNPCKTEDTDCSGGYGVSWVTYHAEKRFMDAHSNWRDRILDAVAEYVPMWSDLCIGLRAWTVGVSQNIIGTGDHANCNGENDVTEQYFNWLENTWIDDSGFWDDDAYQLWTGSDLLLRGASVPVASCFGTTYTEEGVDVARTEPNFAANSVVEGVDYCCADYYDPDEKRERGIVSGHELAHLYGEENHPYKCRSSTWGVADECNIMRNCKDPGWRRFFFTPETKKEIMFRYHYDAEVNSGNEGKPDCP